MQIRELVIAGHERIRPAYGICGIEVGRPELDWMLEPLGQGNEAIMGKLDRLGCTTPYLLELLGGLKHAGSNSPSLAR